MTLDVLLVVAVVVALLFAVTNGFHDASDVIATPVASGALAPGAAVVIATVLNLVGGLMGSRLAETFGSVVTAPVLGVTGLVLVLAGLLGAIAWNVLTWWLAVPSSSTHALVGGLVGAGLVVGASLDWEVVALRVVLPLVAAPVLGFVLSGALALGIAWWLRHTAPGRAHRRFRYAQVASSAGVALGHGLQDAQKTMGVLLLALGSAGATAAGGVPLWVLVSSALALALGTSAGGWRIVRTLGSRITAVDPPAGFTAEATTAGLLTVAAAGYGAAVSTTHGITAAVAGAGAVRRASAVRWRVLRRVAWFWVLTAPASAVAAAVAAAVLLALLG